MRLLVIRWDMYWNRYVMMVMSYLKNKDLDYFNIIFTTDKNI